MTRIYTYRDMESMGLGLLTMEWMDLVSLGTAFGWRPTTTDGGADVSGRRRPSLVAALEQARAALVAAPEERQEILEVGLTDTHCSCCDDILGLREALINDLLDDSGPDDSISKVDEFIEAVQDLGRDVTLN